MLTELCWSRSLDVCSLVERKKQWQREDEERRARDLDADVPAGHRLMPDDERQQTLNRIQLSTFTVQHIECNVSTLIISNCSSCFLNSYLVLYSVAQVFCYLCSTDLCQTLFTLSFTSCHLWEKLHVKLYPPWSIILQLSWSTMTEGHVITTVAGGQCHWRSHGGHVPPQPQPDRVTGFSQIRWEKLWGGGRGCPVPVGSSVSSVWLLPLTVTYRKQFVGL